VSYCSTIKEETRATFTEFNLASDLSGGLQRKQLDRAIHFGSMDSLLDGCY
jgi:hypothetical protein